MDAPLVEAEVLWQEHACVLERRKHLATPPPAPPADAGRDRSLDAYRRAAHALGDLSALCLSGGGIRSAAFALGVMQALARRRLLYRFDYLSTVSGGGYIGSWLTAWLHEAGPEAVQRGLAEPQPAGDGHSPIQHLRAYSNYLTPRVGALSADTLSVVMLYVRNLLLNWLMILPFIAAAVALPKLLLTGAWWTFTTTAGADPAGLPPRWLLAVLIAAGAVGLGVATFASLLLRPGFERYRFRPSRLYLMLMLPLFIGGLAVSLAVGLGGRLFAWPARSGESLAALGTAAGLGAGATLAAWLVASAGWRTAAAPAASTRMTLRAGAPAQSVPRAHRILSAIATLASGAVAGALIARAMQGAAAIEPADARLVATLCFGPAVAVLAVVAGEIVYTGIASVLRWGDAEREWLARAAGQIFALALAWAAFTSLVLYGPELIRGLWSTAAATLATAGGIAGAVSVLIARSSATMTRLSETLRSWRLYSVEAVLALAVPVFVGSLVVLVSAALDSAAFARSLVAALHAEGPGWVLLRLAIALAVLLTVGIQFSRRINVNRFSLHDVYRNRLIRAFLGAARRSRAPNPFTDFDERDNRRLCELWPAAGAWKHAEAPPPIHVINMALNIVRGENLAWQERKAISFTATALAVGSGDSAIGYRPSDRYGNKMTLGSAMTISGAAASPNMGYHTSPALSVLLTIFNVRLGAWRGNPGAAGARTYQYEAPRYAIKSILIEALGLTTSQSRYVYLSDGGHFENLGVYEMLRRRCRFVVVSDAGCDRAYAFADLGNLVRKASIDLATEIRFPSFDLKPRLTPPAKGPYWAVAEILYPELDAEGRRGRGYLLYIKPGFHGGEPMSVYSYAHANPDFPHEPTSDQWFGESQFEAYRALGEHIVGAAIPPGTAGDLRALFNAARPGTVEEPAPPSPKPPKPGAVGG